MSIHNPNKCKADRKMSETTKLKVEQIAFRDMYPTAMLRRDSNAVNQSAPTHIFGVKQIGENKTVAGWQPMN